MKTLLEKAGEFGQVEALIASIRIQTELLTGLSTAVMVGVFVTFARYYLATEERTKIELASHWWLLSAVIFTGLSLMSGYSIHALITGYFHEISMPDKISGNCIENLNYFACEYSKIVQGIASIQLLLSIIGGCLITIWYWILLYRVRRSS